MKEAANARALVHNYAKYAGQQQQQQSRRLLGTGSREERENWAQHAQAGKYHTCLKRLHYIDALNHIRIFVFIATFQADWRQIYHALKFHAKNFRVDVLKIIL